MNYSTLQKAPFSEQMEKLCFLGDDFEGQNGTSETLLCLTDCVTLTESFNFETV